MLNTATAAVLLNELGDWAVRLSSSQKLNLGAVRSRIEGSSNLLLSNSFLTGARKTDSSPEVLSLLQIIYSNTNMIYT